MAAAKPLMVTNLEKTGVVPDAHQRLSHDLSCFDHASCPRGMLIGVEREG